MRFTGGAPTLVLATATPFDVVSCTSPSEGVFADSFSFTYVVSPGDSSSDLSYTGTGALVLVTNATAASNSTVTTISETMEIVDEGGNAVNVTLPVVGSRLSVTGGDEWEELEEEEEGGGALVVDTSNVVLYVTAVNGDGVYYAGESIFIQVSGADLP